LRTKTNTLQYFTPILYFVAFAFAASILVLLPKAIFFSKRRNAYEYIFRHSLIAIIVGLALAYGIYFYLRPNVVEDEGEQLIAIPFYCMLVGIIVGTVRLYMLEKSTKKNV
jgi:amino acid transporter